jgi:hypothetical protein|tara:strand:- start:76 stop:225 length:150 start_codon:yes stop_codon:yes gene_type:complete
MSYFCIGFIKNYSYPSLKIEIWVSKKIIIGGILTIISLMRVSADAIIAY